MIASVNKVIIAYEIDGSYYDLFPRTSADMVDYSADATLKEIILYIEKEIEKIINDNNGGDI